MSHDDRTQTVTMGVDPVEYGRMVGEAQRLLDESKSRADHFEGLSKEIYSQACQQVQTTYDDCPTTSPVL